MQLPKIKRLAIICHHPVQYYAPLFKLLAQQQEIKVFYHGKYSSNKIDKDFGRNIVWDVPLLQGYAYQFSHHIKDINDYSPTAILLYGWSYISHLKILMHFSRKALILFRGDSTLLDPPNYWRAFIKSYLLNWIYRKVDYAVYVGSNNKAYFERYGLKQNQLIYGRHAVDNERFATNRHLEAKSLRALLQIPCDATLILFAGKLIEKKNPQLLLEAFIHLSVPGVHLLIVGDGRLEPTLKAKVLTCRNQELIHFLPFQNQQRMPVVYQACDLFCMPSAGPGETWGLAINEAMAAGKAVLASNKVGAAADLIDGSNGQVFKSGDLRDLTQRLNTMLASKEKLRHMGLTSREKIESWNFQHQLDAIYGKRQQ